MRWGAAPRPRGFRPATPLTCPPPLSPNRYVIGENKPNEPEFKFIYYTGKTLQNTYNGAFVYARQPELPRDAMNSGN